MPLGVRLSDGEIIRAETVTVGIGIVPAVEPLLHAGLKGGNGVAVDAQWGTSVSAFCNRRLCAKHQRLYRGRGHAPGVRAER